MAPLAPLYARRVSNIRIPSNPGLNTPSRKNGANTSRKGVHSTIPLQTSLSQSSTAQSRHRQRIRGPASQAQLTAARHAASRVAKTNTRMRTRSIQVINNSRVSGTSRQKSGRSRDQDVEMELDEVVEAEAGPSTIPAPEMQTFNLPRQLPKPHFPLVDIEDLRDVEPDLEGGTIEFVQQGLLKLLPQMMHGIKAIVRDPSFAGPSSSSSQVEVCLRHPAEFLPTHMLAVIDRPTSQPSQPQSPKGTLYPIHSAVLNAHCLNIPLLEPTQPERTAYRDTSKTNGNGDGFEFEAAKIPVIPLVLPHAKSFPILHAYLYTKRVDQLLAAFFPLPPTSLPNTNESTSAPGKPRADLIQALVSTYGLPGLMERAKIIHGVWSNTCKLAIGDRGLWNGLSCAWEILIDAVDCAVAATAAATSQDQAVRPPR